MAHKAMGEYERLSKVIEEALEKPTTEFRGRKKKTDIVYMLWESQVSDAIRVLLRKETARIQRAQEEELAKERENTAFYREMYVAHREMLNESRITNKQLMDTIEFMRQKAGTGGGLSAQDWDALKGMTDAELRRWAMLGARMANNPTVSNPAEQAKRWVVENRPALAS